jgi:carbon storage regulator CsrA
MLVLTRRKDQQFFIPSLGVTVKVLEAARGQVRIGLDAPDDVAIRRSELDATPFEPAKSEAKDINCLRCDFAD